MDQDSSLSTSFDFNSQAGVMSLLAAVRSSALTPAEKNELRDLVFLYTNGGGDVSVRIALEQKVTAYNIKPVAKIAPAPAPVPVVEDVLPFGSSRPEPSFLAPVVSAATATPTPAVAQAPVTPSVQPVPEVQVTSVSPAVTTVPEVTLQPIIPTPVPVATPTPTPTPTPVPVPAAAPVQPVPEAQATSVPQPVITPIPNPTPVPVQVPVVPAPVQAASVAPITASANPNIYLERIREIKSAVNSKVGNPVNLVDINNEVGREYMNALLEAMKRLSGGAAGQIDIAMQRLEVAYKAVEIAIADHAKATAPAPVIETAPTPVPIPVPVVTQVAETLTPEPQFIPAAPDLIVEKEEVAPMPPQAPFIKPQPVLAPGGASGFDPATTPAATATSVMSGKKVLTPQDLPLASSIGTSPSGDPLFIKEIDDGLEQLLSDWSLFKKSGLFGTGPKGREHPLFKKLAELQIPLLLAGRFEGSTQEIKQSITDYMNGWRYEQGIIYEQGETFEHYLRRVIKQILDLQKIRRTS